jgi:DNA modification methylase
MKLENLRIADLTPDPQNARQHDDKNLKAIMGSLKEFGQRKPIVITEAGVIVAGNGTVEAAKRLGWLDIEVVKVPNDWTPDKVKAFAIADNRTAELANWNQEVLTSQLLELEAEGWELAEFGFEAFELPDEDKPIIEDEIPESAPGRVALGDVWQLGRHRVMCGDSTKPEDVKRLVGNEKAQLLHADPPYGMGKEGDGVANDNLYGNKLDKFQMEWWQTFRPYLEDNASAYIWGNAPELWRLWYLGGLSQSEPLTMRNELTWGKGTAQGQSSDKHRMFPTESERCLFFMLGEQGFNNNSDNYWEGWEPIRTYLQSQRDNLGWNNKVVADFFGFHPRMADHWFSKSQWSFPRAEQYEKLQQEANGLAFLKSYAEIQKEYEALKYGNEQIKDSFYASRSHFDNTHENMTDVWSFPSVKGNDRHGHATPKPIEMMARVIKSSLPKDGLCLEPFGGSGATLIGAEQTNRRCYTMELQPEYCDIIIERWEKLTGEKAKLLPAKAD